MSLVFWSSITVFFLIKDEFYPFIVVLLNTRFYFHSFIFCLSFLITSFFSNLCLCNLYSLTLCPPCNLENMCASLSFLCRVVFLKMWSMESQSHLSPYYSGWSQTYWTPDLKDGVEVCLVHWSLPGALFNSSQFYIAKFQTYWQSVQRTQVWNFAKIVV